MEKKQKICKVLSWFLVFVAASLLVEGMLLDNLDLLTWGVVPCALVLPLYFWQHRLEEKNNPLTQARKEAALTYAYQNKTGSKDEFIKEHGKPVYDLFLSLWIIQEFTLPDSDYIEKIHWEITGHGKNVHKKLFS